MAEKTEAPKKVPPRNDFKSSVLYKGSRATELQGRDPDYVYRSFSTDPEHPDYIGKRLTEHERGNAASGYVTVGPWEVCHSQTDRTVRALDPREDQGKKVDTVLRYGRQVTCRIHKSEYEKYAIAEKAYRAVIEGQIYAPDRQSTGTTSITTVVSKDENANHLELLRQSGHPMPGA